MLAFYANKSGAEIWVAILNDKSSYNFIAYLDGQYKKLW